MSHLWVSLSLNTPHPILQENVCPTFKIDTEFQPFVPPYCSRTGVSHYHLSPGILRRPPPSLPASTPRLRRSGLCMATAGPGEMYQMTPSLHVAGLPWLPTALGKSPNPKVTVKASPGYRPFLLDPGPLLLCSLTPSTPASCCSDWCLCLEHTFSRYPHS